MFVSPSKAAVNFPQRAKRWPVRDSSETSPPGVVVSRVPCLSQLARSSCVGSSHRMTFTRSLLKEPQFAGVTPRNSGWPLHTSSQRHSCNSHSCASVQYSSVPSPWEWNHRGQPVPNGNNLDRVSSTRLDPGKEAPWLLQGHLTARWPIIALHFPRRDDLLKSNDETGASQTMAPFKLCPSQSVRHPWLQKIQLSS